jgi:PAS domain S-box-containing protein
MCRMVSPALGDVYAALLLISGGVALATGLWAYTTTAGEERLVFLGLMTVDTLWAGTTALAIYVSGVTVASALLHVTEVLSLAVVGTWFAFARLYTGRSLSLRRWQNAAVAGALGVAVLSALTNALHGRYWRELTYRTDPFQFIATIAGPLELFANGVGYIVIGVTLYYLGDLFVASRHRASASLLVLLAGSVFASVPNVASNLGVVPVPGYDHTPFGIASFVICAGYAVFGMGMFDIRPVARDALLDEVEDAVLVLDADGRLVDFNAASEALLATADPLGRPFDDVLPAVAASVELPDDGAARPTGTVTLDRGGETVYYASQVKPITEQGSVVGYSVALRDVTDRESYRRKLEERNRQLDRFADTVAHDIQNPLQVASGNLELLEESLGAPDETAEQSLAAVERSVERMAAIVADLRTLSKESGTVADAETEPVAFARAVEEAWSRVDAPEATLTVETDGTVEAERSRLLSVLENLLRNSVEHGRGGTDAGDRTVSIRAGVTASGFYVADDGPGVPPAERESVFEFGHSSRDGGTGYGLAIVRRMVESHGWSIRADSSDEGGARFVVEGAEGDPSPTPPASKE